MPTSNIASGFFIVVDKACWTFEKKVLESNQLDLDLLALYTSGVCMLNCILLKGPKDDDISSSGTVCPSAFGYCSVTSIGTLSILQA